RIGDIVFTFSAGGKFAHDDNPTHGFVSDKTVTVTDIVGPFTLTSVDLGAPKDDTLLLTGFDALGNVVASATVGIGHPGFGFAADHFDAAGTAFGGIELAKLVITDQATYAGAQVLVDNVTLGNPVAPAASTTASASLGIHVGADGPAVPTSVSETA